MKNFNRVGLYGGVAVVLMAIIMMVQAISALPSQLSYQVGQEFVFNLHGTVDARGNVQKSNSLTNGTTSTLDSVYVHRCNEIQKDGSFVFVANMFNTQVGVGQTSEHARASRVSLINKDTKIANAKTTLTFGASDSSALGYDMYFIQLPTGEITQVYYQDGDSPYFVNVKLSAISAFQTYVTQSTATILEQDCVGVHTSAYQAAPAAMLNINKQFTQQNFRSFSDAQVTANNVDIQATAQTAVHPNGYIASTTTSQITNIASMQLGAKLGLTNSTGFDMNMRSAGSLNIALQSQQVITAFNKVSPINNASFKKGSLFEVAKSTIASLKSINYELPMLKEDPIQMISTILDSPKPLIAHHKDLKKLAKFFDSSAPKVIETLASAKTTLMKYITNLKQANNKQMRDKVFFLLTSAKNFEDLFFSEFIEASFDGIEPKIANDLLFHSLLSANTGMKQPTAASIRKIYSMFGKYYDSNPVLRDAALLAFGSLVSRSTTPASVKKDAASTLLEMLDRSALLTKESDSSIAVSILGAIYNAETIFKPQDVLPVVSKLLATEKNQQVRSALRMVMKAFAKKYSIPSSKLTFDDSPYPYNRSITKDYNLGGDTVSVDLHGDFFVGTNFDCNHPNFNYDGRIEAYANVDVLGAKQASIFDAKAAYGKQGAQTVDNTIFLSVFDKVVYQQTLPTQLIDCNLHTYQLYHTSNGFNYEYTVWVSIVPITFSAGATLGLDAEWGWQICDAQLSAMVEVIPSAQITIDGQADIDLLIIKGGIELDASFQAALVPQGYVHGTLCTVGVDVQLQTQPMSANLEAYYAWRDCKFWIVDCHWKQRNQRTLWSWSLPAQQKTLFNAEWKISL
ncbi:lipid transport family protein [Naegleria gruberi]|uniref:Lipid transport family protein n=1 Tax=Naegleria gruberi TaxID=5762 RepID=D2VC80_NAEGR|nr:lipid transport family protein [Naegleria gruberi]EFC45702.1 lipid transport family protein [Naegleria gruberi]|eukprot:XP_002678446.1 lipid transport family protein [Naegleria gruberi strain NEG-M]